LIQIPGIPFTTLQNLAKFAKVQARTMTHALIVKGRCIITWMPELIVLSADHWRDAAIRITVNVPYVKGQDM
jgi:hypothetical protein